MEMVVGDNLTRGEMRDLIHRLLSEVAELRQEVRQLRAENKQIKAENERLSGENKRLIAENQRLSAENQRLQRELAAAKKNSSNSSKPPSSDIVNPPPNSDPKGKHKRRRPGGQPGHPKHAPPVFPKERVDETVPHTQKNCPDCGGRLDPSDKPPRVVQQVEIPEKPVRIEEHQAIPGWCPHCKKVHYPPLPPNVEAGGLFGPRLTALVAYLKASCHASISAIQRFLADVLGVKVSRGYIAKLLAKVSQALKEPYEELRQRLPNEPVINVDETGHRENKKRMWTWCFRTLTYTLFSISESRGSEVLLEFLGRAFGGVLGCDYFSAYRKYMKNADVRVQFCLAHLIRELLYLTTLPDRATRAYGRRMLEEMRTLFAIIQRREKMSERRFVEQLADQKERILYEAQRRVPPTREALNLANRMSKHGDCYFEFILTPDIDPTNNRAEQAMRFVVIDRRITQGTRSPTGRRWCERIWTVMATCAQQGRSAFSFLFDAVQCHFNGQPAPSLVIA